MNNTEDAGVTTAEEVVVVVVPAEDLGSVDQILSTKWRKYACTICGGDLFLNIEDGFQSWDCFSCSRSFEIKRVRGVMTLDDIVEES